RRVRALLGHSRRRLPLAGGRPGGGVRNRRRSQGPAGRQRHQDLATFPGFGFRVRSRWLRTRDPEPLACQHSRIFTLLLFHDRRLYSLTPFSARAVKLTFPSLTATRNATSGDPVSRSFFTWLFTSSANL